MIALIVAVLSFYGVPIRDQALFGAYIALGLAVPGVLLIRVLYPGTRTPTEEISLGLALGCALESFAYIAARAGGAPLLVLAWPISTYAAFLAIPRLRGHWRTPARLNAPIWWSWSLAVIIAGLTLWSAVSVFRHHPLTWPALGAVSPDVPYHLALIGELKHHLPPTVPMVAGEPLYYHWFVYAHLAATSWITGVEPMVLQLRLGMLPILTAFLILIGTTGRRVTGSWTAALITIIGTILVAAPNLYLGRDGPFGWGGLPDTSWSSPTQTFGALLFAPVVLLLIDLFERRRHGAGTWFLLAVFLVAVMGAKASYLPLLAVGLVAVAAVKAARRQPPLPTLMALALTGSCLIYAQFVLFGRETQGVLIEPFAYMRMTWLEMTGMGEQVQPPPGAILVLTLMFLLCWFVTWCGVLGLLTRPRLLLRPGVILMLGIGIPALGAILLLVQQGKSQFFFLFSAYPYLVTVTVYGLTTLLRNARISRKSMVSAIIGGLIIAYLVPLLCGVEVPLNPGQPSALLYRPYLALLALIASAAVALTIKIGAFRAWALVTVMLSTIGLTAYASSRVLSSWQFRVTNAAHGTVARPMETPAIPEGALTAGRWLRAHSDPDDLIATNQHCRWGYENPCSSFQFWAAAFSERRMLVEGWAYTPSNQAQWRPGRSLEHFPFWDTERLQLNDMAFNSPSATSVQRLKQRYGVRWLFVDERYLDPDSHIGDYAGLCFRAGDYAIYRIPDRPTFVATQPHQDK